MDARKLVNDFILNEGKNPPSLDSYIQSLEETLNSLHPSSQTDRRRLEIARENLRNVRRFSRRIQNRNQELEEQVRVLQGGE